MEKFYRVIGKMVTGSIGFSVLLFFLRIINIAMAWVGAKAITWIFGIYLVKGLNTLFNTQRFTVHNLPVILVVLSLFGSYLMTRTTVSEEKKGNAKDSKLA